MSDVSFSKSGVKSASQPVVRRLGSRLHHLYQWAQAAGPFADIWDLCCDHGRLGLHLYQAHAAAPESKRCRVHLIDCVPGIIDKLHTRYAPWMGEYLSIECCDSGDIELPAAGRQLIILAGVGGGTVVDILRRLMSDQGDLVSPVEFMLSPNRNAYELRAFLREHPFELIREEFVSEKGWHHEHLHLCLQEKGAVLERPDLVGSALWNPLTDEKIGYIQTQIGHYRNRVERGGEAGFGVAVDAYRRLLGDA